MTAVVEKCVAIKNNDRIVHHHSDDGNHSCQCDGIQLDTSHIHNAQADSGARRNCSRSNKRRTEREKHEHNQYNHQHREH